MSYFKRKTIKMMKLLLITYNLELKKWEKIIKNMN